MKQQIILGKLLFSLSLVSIAQTIPWRISDDNLLADNRKFPFWEVKQQHKKTYYVNNNAPNADDNNTGTEAAPFKTISRAAALLQAGERVIIKGGTYRESVHPLQGGSGPTTMISYEAAPGEKVIIQGSILLDKQKWTKGRGWRYCKQSEDSIMTADRIVWQYNFSGEEFMGYNPFGMANLMHSREWMHYRNELKMWPHFKRRGMIFVNGIPLEQLERPVDLMNKDSGAFWVEHNGMRIHVKFPRGLNPQNSIVEITTKEQLFVPLEYGISYIRISGITFRHAANGFAVPQRGMISANRGHHWIIENCLIEWANSMAVDVGEEMWFADEKYQTGYLVFRNNIVRQCGTAGLAGMHAKECLIEDNLFEHIGWQDAELVFESGAIKFHGTENTLIRRNIFRNIIYAPGIWLDYLSSKNCRITKNVFTDITTARGAIYIEVSRNDCRVDHNIFNGLKCQYWLSGDYGAGGSALYTDGSDSIRFDHNLIMNIENTGYGAYLNAERQVNMRGGITRWHTVSNNIFFKCEKYAIEFPHSYNFSDGNAFFNMKSGYIKIANPQPSLLLDIDACRRVFGWEKNGIVNYNLLTPNEKEYRHFTMSLNSEKLTLTVVMPDHYHVIKAGPFNSYKGINEINIDPRKKY